MALIASSLKLSYRHQYFKRRLDFLLPENTMAPFLTFLVLEIRIVPETLHQIKNDYTEYYLLSMLSSGPGAVVNVV